MSETRPAGEPAEVLSESAPGDVEASSLTRAALTGVASNWVGATVLIAAQIASTAITARLVSPAQFGAYATAQVATGITAYFTLVALGPGVQRRSHLGPKTVGTAMTLSLIAASLVASILWLAAPAWASLWEIDDSLWTVRALGLSLFFTALTVVPLAILSRRLQFRTLATIETGSLVAGLGAGVAFAAAMHSALALALGQAFGAVLLLVASAWLSRDTLELAFDREDGRELFAFAGQVGGLGLFTYVATSAPSFFVARVFGAATLGLFSRANLIVALPAEYVMRGILKVVFPIYGRLRTDLARTKRLLADAITLTTGFAWPLFALVGGGAPVIVAILLGDRWTEAAPLLSIFAAIVAGWMPCWLLINAAEAFGWMRTIFARQSAFFAGTALTLTIAYAADLALEWLLAGIALTEICVYALTLRPFISRGYLRRDLIVRNHAIDLAIAVGAFAAAATIADLLSETPLVLQALGQLAVGCILIAIAIVGWRRLPATKILGDRVGAGTQRGIVRASWEALG